MTELCLAQRHGFELLQRMRDIGNLFVLFAPTGTGRSTVLREVHREWGGAMLGLKDFVDAMGGHHPLAVEETFADIVLENLRANECVFVDDLHLINKVVCCHYSYPRMGFFDVALHGLATYTLETNKKLVFGNDHSAPKPIHDRAFYADIQDFRIPDYEFFCQMYLGEAVAGRLDYAKIRRFATKLNAHQLKTACAWLKKDQQIDTPRFIEYLRSQRLGSNVDLDEVQSVELRHLKGVDDVIQSLEANIILPLENDQLAAELDLKARRGVLLVGPPGTGKTTVGRALAHRLRSKFFLIDGTFISGTNNFYSRVRHVFEAAKQNAPAIIFIDDSDAIFESGEELGLYRYLLTMLDGLESESSGRICVILTAMDVGNLPPALVRSGRIELWLEMHLPDADARATILSSRLSPLPAALSAVEIQTLAHATEGFTGADLKGLVEDAKALYAYDRAQKRTIRSATEYFLMAVETVRANKDRYASAEAQARQQRPRRPAWYEPYAGDQDWESAG
jgi:ATP-dependent 26S proteasome regulatory subunit